MDKKQALKLYVVLSKAYRSASEADKKEISNYGVNPTEFAVLELLYHKGPQPIQQIASRVLLTSGSMTYVVTQLEKKGLLKRVVSERDRRVYFAELTEAGTKLIADIFPAHEKSIADMMNALSDAEAEILIEQLKKLGKSITNKNKTEDKK